MDMTGKEDLERQVVVIGGGPAGLTAAYELAKRGIHPVVFEKLDKVGGIARTENYKGYYFDMGGHRFFTKSREVNQFWHEVLQDDFLKRPRLSRIYYNRRFFPYPLKFYETLRSLGIWQSMVVLLSYLRWQVFPYHQEITFEQWVTNRFGKRLFSIFFKAYTEKVWGIPTSELSAEWAAQRIKDLDLKAAVLNMFIKPKDTIVTLIEEFNYPRRGPGMLWTKVKEDVENMGGEVYLEANVCGFHRNGNRIESVTVLRNGQTENVSGTDFISSMPVTELIRKLDPPPPPEVIEAASHLTYRDFLTVCLIIDKPQLFDDNWIYVHDPDVHVGRIQNFKNWSPYMVPDENNTSLGLEYFCNEGDEIWTMPDKDLVELGSREIEKIGLAKYSDVIDGAVFRVEKSYPVYDSTYQQHLGVIRSYIESLENIQTIGRNGLHRYNNQDHAMLTGMLAVRNILDGEQNNLWIVNAEQEYHEEIREEKPIPAQVVDEVFARAFTKLDPLSFGTAYGVVAGITLALITLVAVFRANNQLTVILMLLNNYLLGYQVSYQGILAALLWGFLLGFVFAGGFAALRNMLTRIYISIIRRRAELAVLEKEGYFPDEQSRRNMD